MQRERFTQIVEEVLDTLPQQFRDRIHNVAVLVEDYPADEHRRRFTPKAPAPRTTTPTRPKAARAGGPGSQRPRKLLLGLFVGVPATRKSVFDLRAGPDYVVLYQK